MTMFVRWGASTVIGGMTSTPRAKAAGGAPQRPKTKVMQRTWGTQEEKKRIPRCARDDNLLIAHDAMLVACGAVENQRR